jgi:hypothetical protein
MDIQILTKTDFFSLRELDIYTDEQIDLILKDIKLIHPEKYEKYGKDLLSDYTKTQMVKSYFSKYIIEIEKDVYVRGEDFAEVIRFENGQITQRFIGGVNDITLCDLSGSYLNKKVYGMLLCNFRK